MSSAPLLAWFCIRSQPKHEHIAAAFLEREAQIEVFLPRIKFQRPTKRGLQWFTEALFPNYLFARFDWKKNLRRISYAPGVSTVVHFGDRWPAIPDELMAELIAAFGQETTRTIPKTLEPGAEVQITDGSFQGLKAIVHQYYPAQERVHILLDFLGRQTAVQVPADQVVNTGNVREEFLK
jgi:transcriptional antiterminator RfaH